jgi:cystathionine gamma-synthase
MRKIKEVLRLKWERGLSNRQIAAAQRSASIFGHSDLTAGAFMASAELAKPVAAWRKSLGQILAPEMAALLSRSLRTMHVRVRQHNENAMAVAIAMEKHPKVSRVLYPGHLPDFPGHQLAKQQMHCFGGMLSIDVMGGGKAAECVEDRLQVFLLATSHCRLTPEDRAQRGISDGLLRLSVGLEDAGDLIADLEQALDSLAD